MQKHDLKKTQNKRNLRMLIKYHIQPAVYSPPLTILSFNLAEALYDITEC